MYTHCFAPIPWELFHAQYEPKGFSFKDDIQEINMNECDHWGCGPIWNKYTVV